MRLAWYAGASTVLAGGVVLSAFHQRANFYSAMVYLFQSNLCMMILVNLIALVYSTFVYSLQRVCFGQLRAIEVEQLYEKAWFAVTETCLAMTIFRDEIGGFFIVMFVALLTGKVWGWIGEGRIEALEQQPPANPRLFHTRLSISLFLSLVYDAWLLYYSVMTVIDQAKRDMMIMFLFEFAVLLITSLHTALRYSIILLDMSIVKRQTQDRLVERRREIREEREAILRRRAEAASAAEAAAATGQEGGEEAVAAVEAEEDNEPLPDEDDIDEMDIEVAGWEAKGQYILGLDLWTDFTKLCILAVFFIVLLQFYGLPLHIIRDLFMTVRSFIKRLGALMKYRQAIKDMNRYDDATAEDLARENTCIICREDMHVWNQEDPSRIERTRPKKLPCGHILHLGCLKSWMERQQVCPTCRRSVVIDDASNANRNRENAIFRMNVGVGAAAVDAVGGAGAGAPAGAGAGGVLPPAVDGANAPAANGQAPGAPAAFPGQGVDANGHQPQPPQNGGGGALRMFNLGPLRLGFAQGGAREIQEMAQRLGLPNAMVGGNPVVNLAANQQAAAGVVPPAPFAYHAQMAGQGRGTTMSQSTATESIFNDLRAIERRIELGTLELQLANAEAQTLRTMLLELQRLRAGQQNQPNAQPTPTPTQPLDPNATETPAVPAAPATTEQAAAAAPEAATQAVEPAAETPIVPNGDGTTETPVGTPTIGEASTSTPRVPAPAANDAFNIPDVHIPSGWRLIPFDEYMARADASTGDNTNGSAEATATADADASFRSTALAPTASNESAASASGPVWSWPGGSVAAAANAAAAASAAAASAPTGAAATTEAAEADESASDSDDEPPALTAQQATGESERQREMVRRMREMYTSHGMHQGPRPGQRPSQGPAQEEDSSSVGSNDSGERSSDDS